MTDQNFTDLVDIEAIFAELGLQGMSEEKKLEHLKKMNEVLEGRILVRLADYVTEEDEKVMEGKSSEEVADFFEEKGINIFDIATEEALAYKQELIANVSYAQGLIDQSNEG